MFCCCRHSMSREIHRQHTIKTKKKSCRVKCEMWKVKWGEEKFVFVFELKIAFKKKVHSAQMQVKFIEIYYVTWIPYKHEHCKLYANISETSCFRKFLSFSTSQLRLNFIIDEKTCISFTLSSFFLSGNNKKKLKFTYSRNISGKLILKILALYTHFNFCFCFLV